MAAQIAVRDRRADNQLGERAWADADADGRHDRARRRDGVDIAGRAPGAQLEVPIVQLPDDAALHALFTRGEARFRELGA